MYSRALLTQIVICEYTLGLCAGDGSRHLRTRRRRGARGRRRCRRSRRSCPPPGAAPTRRSWAPRCRRRWAASRMRACCRLGVRPPSACPVCTLTEKPDSNPNRNLSSKPHTTHMHGRRCCLSLTQPRSIPNSAPCASAFDRALEPATAHAS